MQQPSREQVLDRVNGVLTGPRPTYDGVSDVERNLPRDRRTHLERLQQHLSRLTQEQPDDLQLEQFYAISLQQPQLSLLDFCFSLAGMYDDLAAYPGFTAKSARWQIICYFTCRLQEIAEDDLEDLETPMGIDW